MNNKITEKLAKTKLSLIFTGLAVIMVLCFLLFIANKEYHESNSFQDFPAPKYANKINYTDVKSLLNIYSKNSIILDKEYVSITKDTFEEFNDKYIKMIFFNTSYQKNSYECNHFALLYKSLLGATVIKGNDNASIAVGAAVVQNTTEWGGIPASNGNTTHMLCLVNVDNEWLIVEPQQENGYLNFIPLGQYPNRILFTVF